MLVFLFYSEALLVAEHLLWKHPAAATPLHNSIPVKELSKQKSPSRFLDRSWTKLSLGLGYKNIHYLKKKRINIKPK